jgi:hypothetical protein
MTTTPRKRALLTVIPIVAVLALSSCDDDPSTPNTTTVGSGVDGGGTDVDDITGDGGLGTVLPSDTSPRATEAPNPNAGGNGAGGAATTAP